MNSLQRLEANRQNSSHSTGPRTEQGIAIAKLNSVKHGIFSSVSIIDSGEGAENQEAFLALKDGLYDSLEPVGTMESLLVDQIVSEYLRLQRINEAEAGQIRLNVDCYKSEFYANAALGNDKTRILRGEYRKELLAEVASLEEIVDDLNDPERDANIQKLNSVRHQIAECEDIDKSELGRIRQLRSIPSGDEMDKFQRYLTSANNRIYKALHELERLKLMRQGAVIHAPIVVDVQTSRD